MINTGAASAVSHLSSAAAQLALELRHYADIARNAKEGDGSPRVEDLEALAKESLKAIHGQIRDLLAGKQEGPIGN